MWTGALLVIKCVQITTVVVTVYITEFVAKILACFEDLQLLQLWSRNVLKARSNAECINRAYYFIYGRRNGLDLNHSDYKVRN